MNSTTAGLAVAIAALAAPVCPAQAAGDKPNIVLLLADDLGYGDVGCYGNTRVRTPNIDALAAAGLRFLDFHSNGAMCSPTRAALLTGRYQQRAGIQSVLSGVENYTTGMALSEVTFAEMLRPAGYITAIFGKWHLGYKPPFDPIRQGFDTYRGYMGGGLDYVSHIDRSGRPDWWKDEELCPDKGYSTELLADYAIRFLEREKGRPFCLYVPFQAVHFPWQGPHDKADRRLGGNYHEFGRKYGSRYDRGAAYQEMIESLDTAVGRIVEAVGRLGLASNTLIFFTSDNGGHDMVASNQPLRGWKGQLWEGGHRVPAIACWPGKIKPGRVTRATALTMDLLPTMLAAAGVAPPRDRKLDGVSLLPLLLDGAPLPERTVFWQTRTARAARRGPWKLLIRGRRRYLFNLEADLSEQRNRIAERPEIANELLVALAAWERDVTAGVHWVRK